MANQIAALPALLSQAALVASARENLSIRENWLALVAKQLLSYRFDVHGHAHTGGDIRDDWLNSFAFQPVSNLARGLSLTFASRCVLAFRYNGAYSFTNFQVGSGLYSTMAPAICDVLGPRSFSYTRPC